jgi:ribosomal protein L7Ae-like RNA K-turn-binding protein
MAAGLIKKAGKLVEGSGACIRAADAGKLKMVIIADDAAEDTKRKVSNACIRNNIKYVFYGKGELFGAATGKATRMSLGITDENMVRLIETKIKEVAGVSEWIRK